MDDLVQWLTVQLDEDERIAYEADDTLGKMDMAWSYQPDDGLGGKILARGHYVLVTEVLAGVGEHIARHDPARVLREIDAKRKLLTRWRELQDRIDAEPDEAKRGSLALTRHGLDMFVYQLGGVYADRPGYREEWRP